MSQTAWTTELSVKTVDEYPTGVDRTTVLVLDSASVHRSTCVQERLRAWRTAGLQLQLLPACLPELNRINILRRFLKHDWLDTLHQRLQPVLKQISTGYTVTFA